jgi:hypothetical protein
VLHRIGRSIQGPVDSMMTGPGGRFHFRFSADTASVYLASAQWAGIEYFSAPIHVNPARPDTGLRIVVADTSSSAPVALEARHVVLGLPGADGSRSVLDLLVLRNGGGLTRVAQDSARPTWSGSLFSGSAGLELGEGDFSPSAVRRQGDQLFFFAPLPPGEKQLVTEYVLPAGLRETRLTLDAGAGRLNVMAAEPGVEVSGAGLTLADTQMIEGRSYRRWVGSAAPGAAVRVTFPRPPLSFEWLLPVLVALVAATLLLAGVRAFRGGAVGAAGDPAATADGLLARLAMLDAEYGGREGATPSDEWTRYREERARLKAELAAALRASAAQQ